MDLVQLRDICLSLPHVSEEIKWKNDLVFSVGGKMFCAARTEPPFQFSCKVSEEEFETLSQTPGIRPAPYLARAKWIYFDDPLVFGHEKMLQLIHSSYRMVKSKLSKKLQGELSKGQD